MPLFDLSVLAGGVVRAPLHEPLHSLHPTLSMAMPARKCACIEMRVPGTSRPQAPGARELTRL